MNPKVCLVIAFYEGDREYCSVEDTKKYQELQLKALKKYKHEWTDVIFVLSMDFLEKEKVEIKDNITYYYRENINLSFGAWIDTCRKFKNKYDYFIFSEDDYVFVKDDFDKKLVTKYKEKYNDEGYMSTFFIPAGASSTIGIISTKELEKINYFGKYIIRQKGNGGNEIFVRKIWLMKCFYNCLNIHNFAEEYIVFPYWGSDKYTSIYTYDKKAKTTSEIIEKTLLCCIQFLDEECNIDTSKKYVFV